ncbi:ABC transporter substrate-binding protein [Brachybacterium squillarum]|uniref:ABC transporter substrate-binding protein n=1 Tax=Brachybacterium squillarum TaxID=661979 RepID=UPI0002629793|nr:ABC transporter substrate-binding protein [Brachybacterium squillarum]
MSTPVRPRRAAATAATALAALALAACGTTDVAEESGAASDGSAISEDCAADTTETSTEAVTLTDDYGRTVELDQPAERVTDVGTRQEPSMDALAGADLDLIIVEATAEDDPVIAQLEGLGVPVLATQGADTSDPVTHMTDLFSLIAEATGRTERAEVVLDEFETTIAEAKQQVADADLPTTDFVYLDGWVDGGNVSIRPFGEGALFTALGEELGLTNAWTEEVDPVYGLGQTDIEGLTTVGDANLFYTGTEDGEDSYVTQLESNELWTSMPAVEEGRAHAFPSGIWTFGGPRSSEQAIEAYVDVISGS